MKYLMTFENNRQVKQHTHQSEDRSSGPQTLERPLPGHTTSLGQLAMTKKVPQLGITTKVAFVSQSTPLNPAGLAVPSPWNPRCPKLIVGRLQIANYTGRLCQACGLREWERVGGTDLQTHDVRLRLGGRPWSPYFTCVEMPFPELELLPLLLI